MPTTAPANRERLAKLMDDRRRELRLNWQQVSELGGIPIKTLHAVRTGTRAIRDTTQSAIEDGLRWERGSVEVILGGGDPAPLRQAVTAVPLRPLVLTPPGPDDPLPPPPPGFLAESALARARPYAEAIWRQAAALRRSGMPDPSGAEMFGEGAEDAATWDDYRRRGLPLDQAAWYFGALVAYSSPSGERGRGTGLARGHP